MVFDFNKPFKDVKGVTVQENIGSQLAIMLGMSRGVESPVKFWGWAVKLENGEPIELDSNEELMLMKFIKDDQQSATALKAQLIDIMNVTARKAE